MVRPLAGEQWLDGANEREWFMINVNNTEVVISIASLSSEQLTMPAHYLLTVAIVDTSCHFPIVVFPERLTYTRRGRAMVEWRAF